MSEIQYNVRMYTPMGEKKGTLTAERRGNELKGWLINGYNHKRIKLSRGGLSPIEYRHHLGVAA